MDDELVELRDGWALWRDVAVRSAGFPISGLDVFGPGDEAGRLRAVAADPRFREAVTWQNRDALHNAVDKVATGSPTSGSKQRQREELVASYWQRYCAKNDTIGFYGPLAWAWLADEGPGLDVRWNGPETCTVHFEDWPFEALADALGVPLNVPLGPYPERDVRVQLERLPDAETRRRGLDALDRLEARRDAIARAAPDGLDAALGQLDAEFEALTGQEATRRRGAMYSGRTLVYIDCLRDADITVGPALGRELARTMPALLAASRWYCGRVFEIASALVDDVLRRVGNGPLAPALGQSLGALLAIPPEVADANAELQRRWAGLLADADVTTLASRADAVFADYGPAWPLSVYHSPDVQVAARSAAAVDEGEFLCVIGDFHPGANPLTQGLFATRHPDRERFLDAISAQSGEGLYLIPPKFADRMTSRIMPAITRPHRTHVAATPGACMPEGYRVVSAADLDVRDGAIFDRDGAVLGSVVDLLQAAMFVAGIRHYNPFPVEERAPRLTLSQTVLRRATWQTPAAAAPRSADDLTAWAGAAGLPRRVFMLSPIEDKPVYVDMESPVLTRIAARLLRRAAEAQPDRYVRFTEMVPGPEDCWLEDADGRRYASELRMIAVDLDRLNARA